MEEVAAHELPEDLRPPAPVPAAEGTFLYKQLTRWAQACPRPLVLVFDEIDALAGRSLYSVLSGRRVTVLRG